MQPLFLLRQNFCIDTEHTFKIQTIPILHNPDCIVDRFHHTSILVTVTNSTER